MKAEQPDSCSKTDVGEREAENVDPESEELRRLSLSSDMTNVSTYSYENNKIKRASWCCGSAYWTVIPEFRGSIPGEGVANFSSFLLPKKIPNVTTVAPELKGSRMMINHTQDLASGFPKIPSWPSKRRRLHVQRGKTIHF
ncbi:uncharacterized protein LOC118187279 [Stegodyphus dumicola]|uniref:uncharacterized protein LOC118187279 n=1 Tax=Stegodyphus dumicola TaxID=202533 RepID=UPI0015AC5E6C|nr:uncharacterized protein LOC118187279 [Stegodyphus dumicola]